MNDPYANIDDPQSYRISRKSCIAVTVALMVLVLTPPVWRNVRALQQQDGWAPVLGLFQKQEDELLRRHLREVESRIEDADFTNAPRRWLQGLLTSTLNEGSRRALIGRDGWLYYRPAIQALVGLGPIEPEPFTVMTDPDVPTWVPAADVITGFARQLDQHDVELWLVPIPVKPMIIPENVGLGAPSSGPVEHADATAFYQQLDEAGVNVLDLTEAMMQLRRDGDDVFLRQDTHWRPKAMSTAAEQVANTLRSRPWMADVPPVPDWHTQVVKIGGSHRGDLAGMIETRNDHRFPPEHADLLRVIHAPDLPLEDPEAPIVLLGDSFVNIFDDPALGFEDAIDTNGTGRLAAGFAQHLAHHLQRPLDVIAINGQGATGVRSELARRGIRNLKSKKAVVWMIAERDLMLSATPARSAQVSWRKVSFEDGPAQTDGSLTGEFQLVERSSTVNPEAVTYTEALHSAVYRPVQIEEGNFAGTEFLVYDWTFRNRILQPAADYRPGTRVFLELEPWDDQPRDIRSQQLSDDLMRFDLPVYFAMSSRPTTALASSPGNTGVNSPWWSTLGWTLVTVALWLLLLLWGIHRTVRQSQQGSTETGPQTASRN